MCGRFSNKLSTEILEEYLSKVDMTWDLSPSYNVAPSHQCAVIQNQKPFHLSKISWGLLPYGKNEGNLLVNARSETVFEKATFKYAIRERRCLILADSFYEWKKVGREKEPYRIKMKESELMVFAGIYNEWISGGNRMSGFVILTTTPNEEMAGYHHRAPVILTSETEQMDWISDIGEKKIQELTQPLPNNSLHIYKVSNALNKVVNNYSDLHREIPEQPTLF